MGKDNKTDPNTSAFHSDMFFTVNKRRPIYQDIYAHNIFCQIEIYEGMIDLLVIRLIPVT